jgi:anti-sigma regulatory factor (Ser/Thr protein kinase)
VLDVARTTDLGGIEVDDLACAVSEAVTNGICHGRPPIRVRLWAAPNRVVAAVTDQGDGPTNPFVGLLPTTGTSSTGLGCGWPTRCPCMTLSRTKDGFTIRFTAVYLT